jgi:HK97 family phage portal protein
VFLSNGQPVTVLADALADTTPLLADASYYGQVGLQLTGAYAAYAKMYKTQLWPYAIVTKIGRATARLPFPVFRKDDAGRTKLSPQFTDANYSAYAELMARPNPRLDPFMLWMWTASTVEVYGEAMWLKLRDDNGIVRELHPLNPTNVVVRRVESGDLVYLYTAGTRNTSIIPAIPASDVVHFKNYTPDNLVRGLSPLEPLRQTLIAEDAARRAAAAMWANGARPSVALSHPKASSAIQRSRG